MHRITPTITFANTDLVPNQQTLATITFPEGVSGMQRSDLTLDVGTLGRDADGCFHNGVSDTRHRPELRLWHDDVDTR